MDEAIDHTSTVVLSANDLRKGMYVSYLDRPWLETSFPFKGFEIKTDGELKQLRTTCEYVFIDVDRGRQTDGYERFVESRTRQDLPQLQTVAGLAQWEITNTTEDEFPAASEAIASIRKCVIGLFSAATRDEPLDIDSLRAAVEPLRHSLERCPDSALYVIRTTDSGDYLYRHAVSCAVMGMILGRAMGLPAKVIEVLGVGCALLDIGKTRVPQELLNRPNTTALSSGEMAQLRQHVARSVELVSASSGLDRRLLEIIASHHERHEGHGYPEGLRGRDIPLTGRIAGMVDFFDAMISQRSYGRRATPNEAMRYIRQQRDKDFCAQLTDQFVQIFRLYPTGSLVEHSDGSVGRVIQQHPTALLAPRVQLILDANKERLNEYVTVDTSPIVDDAGAVCIHKCLPPGSYGIDG
jgi:HD-GYP domain-containing protein (c-di-GMP phosphodiesterase class II)